MGGLVPKLALIATIALLCAAGCGGGGSSNLGGTVVGGGTTSNTANSQSIVVNSGPIGQYADGVFANVTICAPGTATCQTISGVLVDTGSSGLRLLKSQVQILSSLPSENAIAGGAMVECAQFVDGFVWGPVVTADVKLAGESASSVPIQIIDDSSPTPQFSIPSSCSGTGVNESMIGQLLANGLLGVGNFRQDCGSGCVSPGNHFYYACSSPNVCNETATTLAATGTGAQAQNPVWMFSTDNNGVMLQLPQIPAGGALSATGTMFFGIGTQSNNALGGATVLSLAADGTFSTKFNNATYTESVIDSGSNGIFFLTPGLIGSGIVNCPDGDSDFYCPAVTEPFVATNVGANGATSSVVNFSVANAETLFNTNSFAFNDLAGSNAGPPTPSFDWGLPFFFGRSVFSAIEGQTTPAGVGPYVAY